MTDTANTSPIPSAITPDDVVAMNLFYSRDRVTALWAGRAALTPEEVASLGIPAADRLWCLMHWPGLTDAGRRLLACDFAARVLTVWESRHPEDDRPRRAIEVARRYARGGATVEQLRGAYAAADAARTAARAAARAARAAAYAAADADAADAARADAVAAAADADAADAARAAAADAAADAARAAAYAAAADAVAAPDDDDAAIYAAYAAADAAERGWQRAHTVAYINAKIAAREAGEGQP